MLRRIKLFESRNTITETASSVSTPGYLDFMPGRNGTTDWNGNGVMNSDTHDTSRGSEK